VGPKMELRPGPSREHERWRRLQFHDLSVGREERVIGPLLGLPKFRGSVRVRSISNKTYNLYLAGGRKNKAAPPPLHSSSELESQKT